VVHVCNLLDAAAALAEKPPMALYTVCSETGVTNPRSVWTNTLDSLRELLIKEASTHRLTSDDATAIKSALKLLREMGRIAAGRRIHVLKPQQEMMHCLRGNRRQARQTASMT
jgi:hypothetical protein